MHTQIRTDFDRHSNFAFQELFCSLLSVTKRTFKNNAHDTYNRCYRWMLIIVASRYIIQRKQQLASLRSLRKLYWIRNIETICKSKLYDLSKPRMFFTQSKYQRIDLGDVDIIAHGSRSSWIINLSDMSNKTLLVRFLHFYANNLYGLIFIWVWIGLINAKLYLTKLNAAITPKSVPLLYDC